MILGFSTQLNGKPTHFVEKIWKGLKNNITKELYFKILQYNNYELTTKQYPVDIDIYEKVLPKLHTFREDPKDRWKAGMKIDFFINVRKKNMFRFAPVLPVVSIQKVSIEWRPSSYPKLKPLVWIDDKIFYDHHFDFGKVKMLELAHNDGFDSIEDFFVYFKEDFTGKIIHWTDLKY
nr:hypothetical protein [uncultured Flavobacterium sp.]